MRAHLLITNVSRYQSLQANLVETANLGRYAFNEAQSGMGQISQASDIVDGKVSGLKLTPIL